MKKFACLFAVLFASVFCQTSEAGPFGRRGGLFNGFFVPAAPATQPAVTQPATQPATTPEVDPSLGALTGQTPAAPTVSPADYYSTRTAQGVANRMARDNTVRHYGGNPGYEGCGCGATPQAAYSICCYGNSGMPTVDVGYARGSNGTWFCCRRYGSVASIRNPRI